MTPPGETSRVNEYDWAVGRLTDLGRFGIKLGLERTRALLESLDPAAAPVRGIHVAGTNGKGSTAAMAAAILVAAGHTTGTTPSPHLESYTERIQVDGQPISEAEFVRLVSDAEASVAAVASALGRPTEFELLTALAVHHLRARCERLVIEVGMGGRLDATSAIDFPVAVITNVAMDHAEYLGNTIEAIAVEKAGIIRPAQTVITAAEGSALAVIERAAENQGAARLWRLGHELRCELESDTRAAPARADRQLLTVSGPGFRYPGLDVRLRGQHQVANAALAVAAVHALEAGADFDPGWSLQTAVRDGLSRVRWPGRLERVATSPDTLLDGAHNPAAMAALTATLREWWGEDRAWVVFGCMADKDAAGLLEGLHALRPAGIVMTRAISPRAAAPEALAAAWPGRALVADTVAAAVTQARLAAGSGGHVIVCGSLYVVGEARHLLVGGFAADPALDA